MNGDEAGIVTPDEALFQARHADAQANPLVVTLARLQAALVGASPATIEVCRIAQLDADALAARIHALRRRVEQEAA